MISDSQLIRLSFAIAVAGVVVLFFVVQLTEPLAVRIVEINEAMSGQSVITNGTVSSLSIKDGNIFFTLSDEEAIKVVIFKKDAEKNEAYQLENGDKIRVEGKVSIYRDELEIVVEKIENI
jgi:exonuclease VII large subunit